MSVYSALIVQRRGRSLSGSTVWDVLCQPLRIPTVTQVSVHTAHPGGWQDATFVIPVGRVRLGADQYGSREQPNPVWIFDGQSVAFFGAITKAILQPSGDVLCSCDGSYKQLAETRMREVWGDVDVTALTAAPDNNEAGQVNVDGNGDLTLSMPGGSGSGTNNLYSAGDHAAADYFLFGEKSGTRDTKKILGWNVTLDGNYAPLAAFEVRIYGLTSPAQANANGDLLQTFSTTGSRAETADGTHGGVNTINWPSLSGYRCIRIGLWVNQGIKGFQGGAHVKVTSWNVSTRSVSPSVINMNNDPTTSDIVRDIWIEASANRDLDAYLQEENSATTGGMIVARIPDSGQRAAGINFQAWSSPQEIVEGMASLDDARVAIYEPTKDIPPSALVTSGSSTVNYWYRQPPQLHYDAWADPGEPDYIVRLSRGAEWVPNTDGDQLQEAVYVNYSDRKGRGQSVYVEDATTENRQYEQGRHTAIDWQISPSVGASAAATLGGQFVQGLRQPALAGTLTLLGNRPGSIELPGGVRVMKLSAIRLGVLRIVDAKGARVGRITDMTYTAPSSSAPETLVLNLNSPSSARLDRNLARISHRDDVSRHR